MNKTSEPKQSAFSWLMELAEGRRGEYVFSLHWQALLVRSFLILGNTTQRLCDRCVVKFSVR